MSRPLPLWPALVVLGAVLVAWNSVPLRERGMHTRTKDLSFVPDPVLGRMLCLGQCGAASKLQWIDSFAYFELQLDRRDDTLSGSHQSGFQRLYDLLIAEDPDDQHLYEFAAFNTGALLSHHDVSLGYLLRGTLRMPHNRWLWQQAAAELYTSFSLEDRHPEQMDAFLDQWADAMEDPVQRRQVWDWKEAMARRHHLGLAQLEYWQEQLAFFPPDSAEGHYVLDAMREELTRYDVEELQALALAHQTVLHGPALRIDDCSDARLVAARYPQGPPPFAPVRLLSGQPMIRSDPYGYAYLLHEGQVVSPGLERHLMELRIIRLRQELDALRGATVPRSVAEVLLLGVTLPWIPAAGHWRVEDGLLSVDWDQPPMPPWPLRPASPPPR